MSCYLLTQQSAGKSNSFASRNQKQATRWVRKNTDAKTVMIVVMPGARRRNSLIFLKVLLFLKTLIILKIRKILTMRYRRGRRASLNSLTYFWLSLPLLLKRFEIQS